MFETPVPGGALQDMMAAIVAAQGVPDATGPSVFVDGKKVAPGARESGHAAAIFKTNDKTLADAVSRVDVAYLHLYECRAEDLSPLLTQKPLRGLSLNWVPKAVDLEWLGAATELEALSVVDLPKVADLGPLAHLKRLRGLAISGSMTKDMRLGSLGPLAALPDLEELDLRSLRVADPEGLRALAGCTGLKWLWLPNTFETADYAYLAVKLPFTACPRFQAHAKMDTAFQGKDVMVTGRRKPFLNSMADRDKLLRYEAAFEDLKAAVSR